MPESRFLNIEYIFYKIYDFFAAVFGGGSGGGSSSLGQGIGNSIYWTWGHILIIAVILFVVLFCIVIYIRLDIYEATQKRKAKFAEHFIVPQPQTVERKNPRWERIVMLFTSHNPNDWKVAIIDADNILDELTMSMGIPGDTLGERLRNANPNRLLIESAGEAHGIRNRIAHDPNFVLNDHEANRARTLFEATFRAAGII